MQDPNDQPARSISIGGLTILAALVLGVAVWMAYLSPQSVPPAGSHASPAQLSGFRPDAWFLPDEELLGFVEIPAGPFLMGSDPAIDPLAFENEWWSDARAQETVDLPAFYIGRYEVTVAQFQVFADVTGLRVTEDTLQGPPNHPVAASHGRMRSRTVDGSRPRSESRRRRRRG